MQNHRFSGALSLISAFSMEKFKNVGIYIAIRSNGQSIEIARASHAIQSRGIESIYMVAKLSQN